MTLPGGFCLACVSAMLTMKCLAFAAVVLFATPVIAGDVVGSVTDGETGKAIAGAHIAVGGTAIATPTDSCGRFVLRDLPGGLYALRASFIGYVSALREITVPGSGSIRIEFVLLPAVLPGQPITVTATRGKERKTPATFSTLDDESIRERYSVQDIPVLLSELPSSTYYSESGSGIGYTYLNIRGFDSRRIAVMVNGIPQNDPEDHNVYWLDFPDLVSSVEDIQVQRGAGSAFYGPPAIGGSVNLVTDNFARDLSLRLSGGWGSFNTRKYSAAFTSGLVADRYAFHARLSSIRSEGYRDRSWVDFTGYFVGAVRYDATMTTQIDFYGGPISDGLAYYGIPRSYVTDRSQRRYNPISRKEEQESFSQPHYELLHEWRLGPGLTLNTTLFYLYGNGYFDYDGSWAPYSYYRLTPEYGFPLTGDPDTLYIPAALIRAQVTNRQYGWLPRLTIGHAGGELIVGGEFRIHRSLHWGRLQWYESTLVAIPYDYRYYQYNGGKDIVSLYAHELYSLRPDMTLMVDLQYSYQKYRLTNEAFIGTEFSVPYNFLNPRVGMNWNITDQWNLYSTIALTSREPRLKNLYDAAEASTPAVWGAVVPQFAVTSDGRYDFSRPLVHPEHLLNIECGGGLKKESVTATANLYLMEFTDEIVKSGQVDRLGQPITGNAERSRHIGFELSADVNLGAGFDILGNATFSRNRIVRSTDYSSGSPVSLDGNPIAGFPDVLGNVRLTYRAGDLAVSVSGRYLGKQYTDNFRNESNTVDPSLVCDAWASYTLRGVVDGVTLEAKAQLNNMFDTLYAAYGEGDQFFVGAERNGFLMVTIGL